MSRLENSLPSDFEWKWLLRRLIETDVTPPSNSTQDQRKKFWPCGSGVHQGTVLAPVLANFYMSYWDRQWSSKACLFRYIDDWLVLPRGDHPLTELAEEMRDSLPKGVKCHEYGSEKSRRFDPEVSIQFVGLEVGGKGQVRPSIDCFTSFERVLAHKAEKAQTYVSFHLAAARFTQSWLSYYKSAGLTNQKKNEVEKHLKYALVDWLSTREGIKNEGQRDVLIRVVTKFVQPTCSEIVTRLSEKVISGELKPGEATGGLGDLSDRG